jgi:hypothetical protein
MLLLDINSFLYFTFTAINIAGGVVGIIALILLNKRYVIAPKMSIYLFLKIAAMVYLVFGQIFTLSTEAGEWKLKVVNVLWWGTTLYWTWATRFSSMRK